MARLNRGARKLRVCFLIPDFGYGGAQKQCILLLNELQRRDDIQLTLIRFRPGPQDHLLNTDRLRSEYVTLRSNFDLRAIPALVRLVAQTEADVIVSWIRVCDIYSFFVRLLLPQVTWVMTQRNSHQADSWLYRVRDRLGRRADAIVANSPGGVTRWASRKPRGKVYLVDNIAASAPAEPVRRNVRNVLFVGRLEPQKNVLTMMKTFVLVAKSESDLTFLICGDGPQRSGMERLADEAGVSDRFEFLGYRTDATSFMRRAGLLVSLSDYEGLPNVLMEGVQSGCRIVASSIPEHVDFLGARYPYLIRDHHSIEESALGIVRALNSPPNPELYALARQRLAQMEAAAVADKYVNIFRSTVSQPMTNSY